MASSVKFAGHTDRSLRNMYGMVLMKQAKLKLGIQGSEVTLKQVTHFCDALSGEGGKGGTMGHFRESSYAYLLF